MQRLATLAAKNQVKLSDDFAPEMTVEYQDLMNNFEFSKAFDFVWEKVQEINREIDEEKPWVLAKNGEEEKLEACLRKLMAELLNVNYMLEPFIPGAAKKISEVFVGEVEAPKVPLFPKQ